MSNLRIARHMNGGVVHDGGVGDTSSSSESQAPKATGFSVFSFGSRSRAQRLFRSTVTLCVVIVCAFVLVVAVAAKVQHQKNIEAAKVIAEDCPETINIVDSITRRRLQTTPGPTVSLGPTKSSFQMCLSGECKCSC